MVQKCSAKGKPSRRMLKMASQQGRREFGDRKRSLFPPAHPKLPRQLVLHAGYVEDFDEPRTKLADCFSALLGTTIGRRDRLLKHRA